MAELHKRGVAGAVICSDPFRALGKTQAKVLGAPDLPLIMIPHPLGGLSIEQVQGRAEIAAPQIIDLLRTLAN
jgi:hypothetical protein